MSKINDPTYNFSTLQNKVKEEMKDYAYLEGAAQKFASLMYEEFKESIVLVRLFTTVPFGKLPARNQKFVTTLANSAGITPLIKDQTPVLSLLGTRGEKIAWNNHHNSRGHVGIPMASGDFVESIPMISRLLRELGLGLKWIDSQDTKIVTRKMGSMAGVFYVPDAKTAVDQKGRKIIAAQDFVDAHNVKTVFGFGGSYLGGNFVVVIVFTREEIEKSRAEQFMPLINIFKIGTMSLGSNHKIFA